MVLPEASPKPESHAMRTTIRLVSWLVAIHRAQINRRVDRAIRRGIFAID
jgi:hypothetical protein